MLFLASSLLASQVAAFVEEDGYEISSSDQYCRDIAGAYQFVETVNEYNNVEVNAGGTQPPNRTHCEGGVGYLIITHSCKWTYKKVRADPNGMCEDDEGWTDESLKRTEVEFWRIRRTQAQASIGLWIEDFIFTVEEIPGLLGGNAKRIQGIVEKRNGCDLSFEGWAVDLDDVKHCNRGFSIGGRIGNEVFNTKREVAEEESARLTSSSSTVTASDIKDALAKIAAALPDTFSTTSSTSSASGESTTPTAHCAGIAGIYQFVETVNEYDDEEVGTVAPANACHGGLGFLEIHATCEWIYKKVEVGGATQVCYDDAGFDATGILPLENEFYFINREEFDDSGVDFKFSIQKLAGSSHAPTRIQGILEKTNGCDISFEGWLTDRAHIHACRDREVV